jgi:hypothetical protein
MCAIKAHNWITLFGRAVNLRLWHMLDFWFSLANTHKYYNIFTGVLHNISNKRNVLAAASAFPIGG